MLVRLQSYSKIQWLTVVQANPLVISSVNQSILNIWFNNSKPLRFNGGDHSSRTSLINIWSSTTSIALKIGNWRWELVIMCPNYASIRHSLPTKPCQATHISPKYILATNSDQSCLRWAMVQKHQSTITIIKKYSKDTHRSLEQILQWTTSRS